MLPKFQGRRPGLPLAVGGAFILLGVASLGQAPGQKLTLNGAVASTSVRVIGGQAYVPVADVAKALRQSVAKVPGGYEIGAAGGANQVEGLAGKVGDTIFNGAWRFAVTNVREADDYTERYTEKTPQSWKADAGQKLILVDVELRNGQKFKTGLSLDQFDGKINNSLAGSDGNSLAVKSYDVATGDGYHWGRGGQSDSTADLLPGAKQNATLVFQAPQEFHPKDLVFTLAYVAAPFGQRHYSNLRVAIAP